MTEYKVAIGQNNVGGLVTLDPQPRTETPVSQTPLVAVSGDVILSGYRTVDFTWRGFQTYSGLTTFLSSYFGFQFQNGELVSFVVPITASLRGIDGVTYRNYNGKARLMPLNRGGGVGTFRDITIKLTQLKVV